MELYCGLTNREFRVAMANPKTGGVDLDEILSKIDKDTLLLSVMSASNISGYIFDIETIVREARKINPDIYILSDAVQHAPHGVLDVEQCGLDGVTFAPYKMFGIRGCGYGYVSDRVAKMTHHKLLAKPEKSGSSAPSRIPTMQRSRRSSITSAGSADTSPIRTIAASSSLPV